MTTFTIKKRNDDIITTMDADASFTNKWLPSLLARYYQYQKFFNKNLPYEIVEESEKTSFSCNKNIFVQEGTDGRVHLYTYDDEKSIADGGLGKIYDITHHYVFEKKRGEFTFVEEITEKKPLIVKVIQPSKKLIGFEGEDEEYAKEVFQYQRQVTHELEGSVSAGISPNNQKVIDIGSIKVDQNRLSVAQYTALFIQYKIAGNALDKHIKIAENINSISQVINLFKKSAEAVKTQLSDKGILHRDIKPGNFLYDPATDSMQLVDYDGWMPLPGTMVKNQVKSGTAGFIPPESMPKVGQQYQNIHPSFDIYALGKTFDCILSACKETNSDTIDDNTLKPFKELIEKMTNSDPQQRPSINHVVHVVDYINYVEAKRDLNETLITSKDNSSSLHKKAENILKHIDKVLENTSNNISYPTATKLLRSVNAVLKNPSDLDKKQQYMTAAEPFLSLSVASKEQNILIASVFTFGALVTFGAAATMVGVVLGGGIPLLAGLGVVACYGLLLGSPTLGAASVCASGFFAKKAAAASSEKDLLSSIETNISKSKV